MLFRICGSSASEGIPALFCPCEICIKARQLGGKEIRTRTAYQFDQKVRIDFGPDLLAHQTAFDLHLDLLEDLFITHDHKDHFTPLNLVYRNPKYAKLQKIMRLHAGKEVLDQAEKVLSKNSTCFAECKIEPVENQFFRECNIGQGLDRMIFTPLPADHLPKGQAFIYDVQYGKKRLLIATDSGIFPPATWEFFRGKRYDLAVLDGTSGVLGLRQIHMGRECVLETVGRLRAMGTFDEHTLTLVNHFSHNGKMNHDDLENFYQPSGIQPGYDGWSFEIPGV